MSDSRELLLHLALSRFILGPVPLPAYTPTTVGTPTLFLAYSLPSHSWI